MAGVLVKMAAGNQRFRCLTASSNPLFLARRFITQLLVRRVSPDTTIEALRNLFSPYGEIIEARLVVDEITQTPKGFAYITFKYSVEARKALRAIDGNMIDGRLILVEVANAGIQKGKNDS